MRSSPRRRSSFSGSRPNDANLSRLMLLCCFGGPLRLFDLQLTRDAVQLAVPLVAAVAQSLAEARRQRLLLNEVPVPLERARDRTRVAERDAIRDLEARLFTQVVEMVRELSRQPLELELGRHLCFERDDRAGVPADRVPGRALMRDEHLGVRELEPFDLDRPVAPLVTSLRKRLPYPR